MSPDGGGLRGPIDPILEAMGLARQVVLSVPHFLFLRAAVTETDLVALLPSRLVRGEPSLRTVPAPLDVPGFAMAMVWHERSHRDPAHVWLRDRIASSLVEPRQAGANRAKP